ncbi:uncharacterized protein LOC124816267 [Hydra vulgaris]|uniref:uncharacterized protein LOC124816267 n=1 Tax=Hydra vulgaris TaxID=6087 RepID=UPI0032EA8C8A
MYGNKNCSMERYGNELAFLDATYRTTRYALPLFFLVVKTNIDYQVVAIFVCENETTEAIAKALMCIKEWNPLFYDRLFKRGNKCTRICVSREQAWERWLSKTINGCCLVKDQVKKMLRDIAHAKTEDICQKAVQGLQESQVWKIHQKLAEYLTNTWLPIQKRWVFAYRQDRLLLNVNTNNGTERQHQSFKYSFLEKRKNSSITAMLSICIEEFLPHKFDNYCDKNKKAHSSYRKYNAKIPPYLIDRPRPLVKHCMHLIDTLKGLDLQGINAVTDKIYNVASFDSNSREIYKCYLGGDKHLPSCSCPAWFSSPYPCKHFFAIFIKENLSWSAFGSLYRNSPYFSLDLLTDENSHATSVVCQDFFHPNNVGIQNNAVGHETQLSIPLEPQPFPNVQGMNFKSTIAPNKIQSSHSIITCRELLSEITQMSYLCNSQKNVDLLFEGLYKLKTDLVKSITSENGILLRPDNKPDTWSKTEINSTRLCHLPIRRKRKMTKRVGVKYDVYKAASDMSVVTKKVSLLSEITTNHSINESCDIFTVPIDSIKTDEKLSDDSNELLEGNIKDDGNHIQRTVQSVQYLKSSLIGNLEMNEIENGEMLNDKVIHYCQQVMSMQLDIDVGLQDPIKGQVLAFNIHPNTPFVQVLHDGNLHWICVTTYGCAAGEIYIFDSLFHGAVSFDTKRQICSILQCDKKYLMIKVLPIQQQTNGVDCGLYAIAWARQILEVKGIPSTSLMFEESEMRKHLLMCILKNRLDVFPTTINPAMFKKCAAKDFRIRLHCSCRMFWTHKDENIFSRQMAQCFTCKEWFHRQCERIPQSAYEQEDELWYCQHCNSIADINTTNEV